MKKQLIIAGLFFVVALILIFTFIEAGKLQSLLLAVTVLIAILIGNYKKKQL
ncbi:hypothetical protein KZO01_13740 [Kurthia zopfii]|uniref:Uncharacterized protein n=1 Tax=Kurthia zopfii TaxID=1650 RepID=A0A8B4Q9Q7_9BACL|nr:hypothetical protein [Kurthia zopfii]TDR36023.1 hypothetical protein DFR61_12722 [Kurthia zopfii]GEK31065.1 hypothetical protein KZO01_13740 [Kurthia zopfii]STX09459.1 Uncharacterised protein [Kurthia zopfii]VEI06506.1 Uncharacterised protein [Kurthia zopfii]